MKELQSQHVIDNFVLNFRINLGEKLNLKLKAKEKAHAKGWVHRYMGKLYTVTLVHGTWLHGFICTKIHG